MRPTSILLTLSFLLWVGCLSSCGAADQTSGEGSAAAAPVLGSPVGYWSFDKADIAGYTAIDKSGNGHDGVIDGAAPVAGMARQALHFDGSGGCVTIEGLGIKGKELSVSLWLRKEPSTSRVNRLVFLGDFLQVGFFDALIFVHTGTFTKADVNNPYADFGVVPGKWHHLAVTWDTAAANDNVKVYLDGALRLAADLTNARNIALDASRMVIASSGQPDSKQVFLGTVDEVALYDKVLTAREIKESFTEIAGTRGAGGPVGGGAGKVIRFPREPEELYVPKVTYSGPQKLIRVGSELCSLLLGVPSISEADLPAKVKVWQQTGLDGLVFSMASHDKSKGGTNVTGQWWNLVRRDYEEFVPEIKAFQSVKDWGRLTDNFLWSSMAVWGDQGMQKGQDWFSDEDWEIILSNVRLHARIAGECGFKGILLDTEQYEHHAKGPWYIPFSYPLYAEFGYKLAPEETPRPFAEIAAQIRQRGTQYAQAVCEAFPGVRLIVIPGLYECVRWDAGPLEKSNIGLYPSFLDGLLAGLDDKATIIGGSEQTYNKTSLKDIMRVRKSYDEAIEELCKAPAHLKGRMSFAAGIWAEPGRTWSDTDVSQNARSPEDHKLALQNAFKASGEYAWLYGEKSFFLTTDPTSLMREYFQANVDAHEDED